MATVTPTVENVAPNAERITWAGMVTGDTITGYSATRPSRAAVQASGTFAVGTVVGLTGSIDGTNYIALTDLFGTALTGKTAAFLAGVAQVAVAFKPTIGSGAGDAVTISLILWW